MQQRHLHCLFVCFLFSIFADHILENRNISILFIAPAHNKELNSMKFAIKRANSNYKGYGRNITLRFDYLHGKCEGAYVLDGFVKARYTGEVSVIVGPSCSAPTLQVAFLAAHWNIPVIGYKAQAGELSNSKVYSTYNHANPSVGHSNILALTQVLTHFNWKHLMLLFLEDDLDVVKTNTLLMYNHLLAQDYNVFFDSVKGRRSKTKWEWMAGQVRVIVIMYYKQSSQSPVFKLLHESIEYGYFENGCGFVLILINGIAGYEYFEPSVYFEGHGIEAALECSLLINSRRLRSMAEVDSAVVGLDYYIVDGMGMYASALNVAFQRGISVTDGRKMSAVLRENPFQGYSGRIKLNQHGDRYADLYLYDFDASRNRFFSVGYLDGTSGNLNMTERVIWWDGSTKAPTNSPPCGFNNEICVQKSTSPLTESVGYIAALSAVSILTTLVAFFLVRRRRSVSDVSKMTWKIDASKIEQLAARSRSEISGTFFARDLNVNSMISMGEVRSSSVCTYESSLIYLKRIEMESQVLLDLKLKLALHNMKNLTDDNVATFLGADITASTITLAWKFYVKGTLRDVLMNGDMDLDESFKFSFILDIAKGMNYIHKSPLRIHGNLRTTNTVVDSRFLVKVSDFGLNDFRANRKFDESIPVEEAAHKLLWVAPELLANPERGRTQSGDVYSFAFIAYEVFTRSIPWGANGDEPWSPVKASDIVASLSKTNFSGTGLRPPPPNCESYARNLVILCWHPDPESRPTFLQIEKILRGTDKGKQYQSIVEHMMSMMEKHANNLEQLVNQRTLALYEEQKKTDELLCRMMPKSVSDRLKQGNMVPAEYFAESTVFFSDIVQFTSLSASCSPLQVVQLLNSLFSLFDEKISLFPIYKVETIGDAYMVVSGVPNRIKSHAKELAEFALLIIEDIDSFQIPFESDWKVQVRIGMHTGPCMAGVVGHVMPRYCLFGDTINVAGRMKSTGVPMKIHISGALRELLLLYDDFAIVPRGRVEIKGGGLVMTYWVERNLERI